MPENHLYKFDFVTRVATCSCKSWKIELTEDQQSWLAIDGHRAHRHTVAPDPLPHPSAPFAAGH